MKVFDSNKILAFVVMLLAFTLAVHAVVPKGTAAVKEVKDVVVTPSGDFLEARITTTAPARVTYFELAGPRRLVVDFHDLQNSIGFKEKVVWVGGVERIRTSLFTSKDRSATRIVFDLTDKAHYQVLDEKTQAVRVKFGEMSSAIQTEAPVRIVPPPVAPIPAPLPAAPVSLVASLTAQDVRAPVVPPVILASAAPVGRPQINSVPPAAPGSTLSAPAQASQYSGELVSFDVRDLEFKDFFRLISETSGINIITDLDVNGTLPMLRLTEIPWDQALDVVLKQNQLRGELQGNVLRIAKVSTLLAEEAARKSQLDAKDAQAELVTHTYILNYTKADAVAATLTKSVSKRGEILQDLRKNALIVTDIPSQFAKVDQMVKFLDTPAQQVEINARLLSANKSFSKDIGSQLGLLFGNKSGNMVTGGSGAVSPFKQTPAPRATTGGTGVPLVSNLPAAATSGLAFLIQPGGDVLLDEIITMEEASGRAKLISSPSIITQNNQAATVSQGTQIPVQTSVNNTVSVSFITFALNLSVTPQITEAGTILLTIQLENSVPDFARAVNGIPSVATQQAKTQVLIPDGGTAVIGGIYVDTDSLNVRQVPGLGSVPVIGRLFKETATIKSTSELFFFVTPKIKSMDQVLVTLPDIKAGPSK